MNVKLIGKHEKDSRACRDAVALPLKEMMAELKDASLEAWVKEEDSRIRQLIGQLPVSSEKGWEALDQFFLGVLERL